MKRVKLGLGLLFLLIGVLLVNVPLGNPTDQANAANQAITQDEQNGTVVANDMFNNAPTIQDQTYCLNTANTLSNPVPEVAYTYIGNNHLAALYVMNPLDALIANVSNSAPVPEVAYDVILHINLTFLSTNLSPMTHPIRA